MPARRNHARVRAAAGGDRTDRSIHFMASNAIEPGARCQPDAVYAGNPQIPHAGHEEEERLARAWRDNGDHGAAHKLVNSHLRLVAKIAMGYRGYGLPVGELISEGNVGMMQAVKRFDPDRGFRLSTYAMWWIRAAIQEYILH